MYSALDTLVLSSENEGVPISVIEAMAARVPVVATHVGGVPDLLPDPRFGALVPPNDPDTMAEAILAALNGADHDLAAASAFVRSRYDMRLLADQTGALYRELLSARKGKSLFVRKRDVG